MSDKPSPEQDNVVASTTTKRGMNRRNFLKASAASAGAGALAAMPTVTPTSPSTTAGQVLAAPVAQNNNQDGSSKNNNPLNLPPDKLANVAETWAEPSVWRPSNWPGQPLPLHVVENAAPMAVTGTSFTNINPLLFSYNGTTPGPTIRMKGDETLFIHLRNMLGPDLGQTPIGVYVDPAAGLPGPEGAVYALNKGRGHSFGPNYGQIPADLHEDWCLGEHTNGIHSNHVTNLHTHGLHVRPATNPDGTHTDNVILRILPQDDWARREASLDPSCRFLRENEIVGQAPYEFRLGDVQDNPKQLHPAGTFWYHPHSHGATHNQVAAGMAGFLIVEGDIEDALYDQLVKSDKEDAELKNPVYTLPYDPARRSGPYDYRERLMFIQRVQVKTQDPDAVKPKVNTNEKKYIFDTKNGGFEPRVIKMRPGAIERWRILNGSVDGKSYMRFMVLKGRYEYKPIPDNPKADALFLINADGSEKQIESMTELTPLKHPFWLLAWDGITLVRENESGEYEYYIQDLNFEATPDPLVMNPKNGGFTPESVDAAYKDADSVKAAYVQPNELDMSAANRADVLIQAPTLDEGVDAQIYTVVALGTPLHAHTFSSVRPDTIVSYLIVSGDTVEGKPDDAKAGVIKDLSKLELPPVQEYLKPVTDDELTVLDPKLVPKGLPPQQEYVLHHEIDQYNSTVGDETETVVEINPETGEKTVVTTIQKPIKVVSGNCRTRRITYAGWGAAGFPVVDVPDEYVEEYSDQQNLRYYKAPDSVTIPTVELPDGITLPDGSGEIPALTINNLKQPDGSALPTILLPPGTRTMSIDGRKFNPTDAVHPQMLWWTAEEWMLTNNSVELWVDKNAEPIFFTADNIPPPDKLAQIITALEAAIKVATGKVKEMLEDVSALYKSFVPDAKKGYVNPTYWDAGHRRGYPMTRAEARNAFGENATITTNAADHPFHMHQNPFWVMRIDVPDENGNLVNILDQPRWQDTIWIPRNGGRIIFRSRFPDYLGVYVNHCHLLQHEDNGMMQAVETVPTANSANYVPAKKVLYPGITDAEVDDLYPTDSKNLAQAWINSISFIDPDPNTGQVYPGFEATPPTLAS
ncbi:MAG: multicopper oxidase domain-containing protein [Chloroflexota bacterium]